jgi:hypothetical protein
VEPGREIGRKEHNPLHRPVAQPGVDLAGLEADHDKGVGGSQFVGDALAHGDRTGAGQGQPLVLVDDAQRDRRRFGAKEDGAQREHQHGRQEHQGYRSPVVGDLADDPAGQGQYTFSIHDLPL